MSADPHSHSLQMCIDSVCRISGPQALEANHQHSAMAFSTPPQALSAETGAETFFSVFRLLCHWFFYRREITMIGSQVYHTDFSPSAWPMLSNNCWLCKFLRLRLTFHLSAGFARSPSCPMPSIDPTGDSKFVSEWFVAHCRCIYYHGPEQSFVQDGKDKFQWR